MINVSATYWQTDHKSKALGLNNHPFVTCRAGDAIALADKMNDLPELSSRPSGVSGHKGWLTVKRDGLTLIAYFMDGIVDFELYAMPELDGCGYCNGELTVDSLKNVLAQMNDGLLTMDGLTTEAVSIDLSPRE